MTELFQGTGVAIVTPFTESGEVDFLALERLVESLINNGVNYLVVMGTTGESVTLSKKEKNEVVKHVLKINDKRLPIIVGVGGNNTLDVIDTLNNTNFDGIDAILSVCPYYNKPTQEGIFQHYKLVAEAAPRPVMLYNVPSRTGVNMTAETTIRIAKECKNVFAVKEAAGDMSQAMQLVKNKPEGFLVISGEDEIALPLMSIGFDGVVSVVANAYPKEFSEMLSFAKEQKYSEALNIHYKLVDIVINIFAEGNPAGVKAILHHKGIMENVVRLPLLSVSDLLYTKLKKLDQLV